MKVYDVTVEITKPYTGEVITATVQVYYPRLDPRHSSSCISERERENDAIEQIRRCSPGGTRVRALRSIANSSLSHRGDTV